jgi:hypothetical protein
MKAIQSFEIFVTTYPVAEGNVLGDLNHLGGFISRTFFFVLTFHTLKSVVRHLIEIPRRGDGRSLYCLNYPFLFTYVV